MKYNNIKKALAVSKQLNIDKYGTNDLPSLIFTNNELLCILLWLEDYKEYLATKHWPEVETKIISSIHELKSFGVEDVPSHQSIFILDADFLYTLLEQLYAYSTWLDNEDDEALVLGYVKKYSSLMDDFYSKAPEITTSITHIEHSWIFH